MKNCRLVLNYRILAIKRFKNSDKFDMLLLMPNVVQIWLIINRVKLILPSDMLPVWLFKLINNHVCIEKKDLAFFYISLLGPHQKPNKLNTLNLHHHHLDFIYEVYKTFNKIDHDMPVKQNSLDYTFIQVLLS